MSEKYIFYISFLHFWVFGNKMSTDYVSMGIKWEYFGINGNIRGIKESVAFVL